jgi:hypothetical protein
MTEGFRRGHAKKIQDNHPRFGESLPPTQKVLQLHTKGEMKLHHIRR